MTILDTLPALPWRVETFPDGSWDIFAANGRHLVSAEACEFEKREAQALVSLVNSYPAMVEALEWYAKQVGNCRKLHSEGDDARHALTDDNGNRALAALALIEEKK